MDITIALAGMDFGPETPNFKSLGGSETAALSVARELRKRDHSVTVFCNLPQDQNRPDYHESGKIAEDGIRYVHLSAFQQYTISNECDLSIIVRSPELAAMASQARKKALWMHDLSTKKGMGRAFEAMQWCIDEVWCVSQFHADQVHEVTGYPKERIVVLRNGITEADVIDMPRSEKTLIYAARPERGLDNLIKPGGIMDNLPDYKLKVAMYDHFPEHMREYYQQIFARMEQMPNVEYIGGKPNSELRQLLNECAAYIYPTQFEETSCILARECIEQRTPFFTTRVGALPETLGNCAAYFEDYLEEFGFVEPERGSVAWCKLFAQFFREGMNYDAVAIEMRVNAEARDDLYWDGVADMIEKRLPDNSIFTPFSIAWSMIQDGDVIAARSFLEEHIEFNSKEGDPFLVDLWMEIYENYRFLRDKTDDGYITLAEHYEQCYTNKEELLSELHFHVDLVEGPRQRAIRRMLDELPSGQRIVEFGCGPGHLLAGLAKLYPQHEFFGIEISKSAVEVLNKGAKDHDLKNLSAVCGSERSVRKYKQQFDVSICSEVLEHVPEPWKTARAVESMVKPGGRCIYTVPFGPWEPLQINRGADYWKERAHIWLLDRKALREMFFNKQNKQIVSDINQHPDVRFGRVTGNTIFAYEADHKPIGKINVKEKWKTHNVRQTVAAAIIAYNNEDTILRCLESLKDQVQLIQIAHGPSTDDTLGVIRKFAETWPHVRVNVIEVPKIEPWKYGFSHARNDSIRGLERSFEFALWIDTDEYLSGDITPFLRDNCLDGYVIPQHHFTVEPRGMPLQIDRPARLIRLNRGYRSIGHIHEHFELVDEDGSPNGPGRVYELPRVDIGHTGYVDETVRQARFQRNFEFLKWEKEDSQGRKLFHFLWFRDMIHFMRLYQKDGLIDQAAQVAKTAVEYYNEHWKEMCTFGPGFMMSQGYLTEAYRLLGIGTPIQVQVKFDDRAAMIEGQFENFEQIARLFEFLVEPEIKERNNRYY